MPTYNDYGIVLKSYDFSEADKIFYIYTKENGLVKAIGKNIRKSKSKISGKVDQLSCSYFQFAKGKNLDVICDIEQITSFPKLRVDSSKIFYGILFLDIVNNFAHEGESDSQENYELLYSSLDELQFSENVELTSLRFISGFLSIHGFKPQLETCVACSKQIEFSNPQIMLFPYSSILGGLLCNDCLHINHKMIQKATIDLLQSLSPRPSVLSTEDLRSTLKLLQDHLNARSKKEIKSFDLVFSL